MQHSLSRLPNERVKLFSQRSSVYTDRLRVYKFDLVSGITAITPAYSLTPLNEGYYSTEITTPNEHCYLLILFNYRPIVLRIGTPKTQFFYWSQKNTRNEYKHYNEYGALVSEGALKTLLHGFYYYTPIEDDLGYIEVNDKPHILNLPYKMSAAGVGINVDWRKTIIRREFGVNSNKVIFKLNTTKNEFNLSKKINKFEKITTINRFDRLIIKQDFKVSCKN